MRKMGGLRKYMPSTHWTMAIATYAIAGLPFAAGFVSKDEILASAWGKYPAIWVIGAIAAAFTAFYMSRLYFMTFWGEYRGAHAPVHADTHDDEHADAHHHSHDPHESPRSMTGVLWVLAVLSIVGGHRLARGAGRQSSTRFSTGSSRCCCRSRDTRSTSTGVACAR
jgi:NADH:ubiquinone oxidoreductase subunit 5 (subunit L)/multisubunit Na+/H+ antiporter MnhA subunit